MCDEARPEYTLYVSTVNGSSVWEALEDVNDADEPSDALGTHCLEVLQNASSGTDRACIRRKPKQVFAVSNAKRAIA